MTDTDQNRGRSPDDAEAEPAEEAEARAEAGERGADEPEAERETEADEGEAEGPAPGAEAEESAAGTGKPKPRKRKKRKRKKKTAIEEPELRPARDAQGRDRPAFLLAFPHDPELDRLVEAYEAGDYATVRRDAPALAERTGDAAVRDAAWELRRRIDPDPLARYLLLTGIVLLVFLVIWVYTTTQGR